MDGVDAVLATTFDCSFGLLEENNDVEYVVMVGEG